MLGLQYERNVQPPLLLVLLQLMETGGETFLSRKSLLLPSSLVFSGLDRINPVIVKDLEQTNRIEVINTRLNYIHLIQAVSKASTKL